MQAPLKVLVLGRPVLDLLLLAPLKLPTRLVLERLGLRLHLPLMVLDLVLAPMADLVAPAALLRALGLYLMVQGPMVDLVPAPKALAPMAVLVALAQVAR